MIITTENEKTKYLLSYEHMQLFIGLWNNNIEKYGAVAYGDLFDDIFFLGTYESIVERKDCKHTNYLYGWTMPINEGIFKPVLISRKYYYELQLPEKKCLKDKES